MRNTTLARALQAAAAVLEADGEEVHTASAAIPVTPSLASKVRDFLANDTSGYDWRSAKAIGQALGASEADVAAIAANSSELRSRHSSSGLGLLISLRD